MASLVLGAGGSGIILTEGAPARAYTFAPAAPTLSGTTLPQQDLLRGVALASAIDFSVLFSGSVTSYSIDGAGDPLPGGLNLNTSTGQVPIGETPTEGTLPTQLPIVQITATGPGGSATYTQGVVFSVTGPELSALSATGNTVSLTTGTGNGTMHLWFGTDPNPSDADLINGTGTGFLAERDFTVTGSGGSTTNWDLSAHDGVNGYLFALQVAADGSYSNRVFIEFTPQATSSELTHDAVNSGLAYSGQPGATSFTTTTPIIVPAGSSIIVTATGNFTVSGGLWNELNLPKVRPFGTGGTGGTDLVLAQSMGNFYGGAIYYFDTVQAADKDGSNQIEIYFDQPGGGNFEQADIFVHVVSNMQTGNILDGTLTDTGSAASPVSAASGTTIDASMVFWAIGSNHYSDLTTMSVAGDATTEHVAAIRDVDGTNNAAVAHLRADVGAASQATPTIDGNRFTAYRWAVARFRTGA